MDSRLWRWCGLCVALLSVVQVAGALGESRCAEPETPAAATPRPTHPLQGRWRIDYHPNAAVREYTITENGLVSFANFPSWKGKLAGNGGEKSGYLLRFEGTPKIAWSDLRGLRMAVCWWNTSTPPPPSPRNAAPISSAWAWPSAERSPKVVSGIQPERKGEAERESRMSVSLPSA